MPPQSTSRVIVSSVRPADAPKRRVACSTLRSIAVISSMSLMPIQSPYWLTVAVTAETLSLLPGGVVPSVSAVSDLGSAEYFRNSIVLPLPCGMGYLSAN